jgi:hypothetical protein
MRLQTLRSFALKLRGLRSFHRLLLKVLERLLAQRGVLCKAAGCQSQARLIIRTLRRHRRNYGTIQDLFEHHEELLGGRGSKRNRRQAHEVDKMWACPYQRCFKNYGSEISLNLHMKLKHNGGNKSERDRAAVVYK